MTNRIREVRVINHRLDPNETELRIHVAIDDVTPTTEIKGRLMGPRCAYRSTVEIAYAMRAVERGDSMMMAVIIPEPSWWEPKLPFLYEGPLELWQDGQLCERIQIGHAIRWLQLTSKGLRLNGRPFLLRGKCVEPTCDETEMRQLHDAGFNLAFASPSIAFLNLKRFGDRHGLFVQHEATEMSNASERKIRKLNILENSRLHDKNPLFHQDASVMYCREEELPFVAEIEVPKIVLAKHLPEPLPARVDVIGWIETFD